MCFSERRSWRFCLTVRLIDGRKIEQNRDMDRRDLRRELHLRQRLGGGWSFTGSQQISIEATCLAALALADETQASAGVSTEFLLKSQFADGSWPVIEGDSEGSWTTALSLCYLNGMTDFASAREKAFRWLMMSGAAKRTGSGAGNSGSPTARFASIQTSTAGPGVRELQVG